MSIYRLKNRDGRSVNLFLRGSLENCETFLKLNKDLFGYTMHETRAKPRKSININLMFKLLKNLDTEWTEQILADLKFNPYPTQEFYTLSIDNNEFMEMVERW